MEASVAAATANTRQQLQATTAAAAVAMCYSGGHEYRSALSSLLMRYDSAAELFTHRWWSHMRIVANLSASVRKEHSYNGAVRSRPGEPAHHHCAILDCDVRDVCNANYSRALSMILLSAPHADEYRVWLQMLNEEKQADICECILGLNWKDETSRAPTGEWRRVAQELDNFVHLTLCLLYTSPSPRDRG